jgi:GH43 family beta-xylosidase
MISLLPPHSADPWMIFHNGFYYYCQSPDNRSILIRKSKTIAQIGKDSGVTIWQAPKSGPNCNAVWAPELHFIHNRWFIYYAADDGDNRNHKMWVLESLTDDPQGAYRCCGHIDLQGWAIDGTVAVLNDEMFFIWSGWPLHRNGKQSLYIAPMKDPLTIKGERILLTAPNESWEKKGMPICEGPQVLVRHGKVFVVYSASASWTVDYCLGLLVNKNGNLLDSNAWEKIGPVFKKTEEVWGVGHCCFVNSPCKSEDWIIYHAKSKKRKGWTDRRVHAQRFGWTSDGLPHFGNPLTPLPKYSA